MFLEMDQWSDAYTQILYDCRSSKNSGGGSVLLLCHPDADAVAAARIWTYLLRNDGIRYQLLPCRSWKQLQRLQMNTTTTTEGDDNEDTTTTTTTTATDACAVILLNLGANKNLTRLGWTHNNNNNTKVYVMDCRRPVHLANLYAESNVVVFWDGVQHADEVPSDGDNLSGNESSSSSDDDDDDEQDSLDSDDDPDGQEHEFEMDEDDDDDDQVEKPKKMHDEEASHPEQETDYDGEDEKEHVKRDNDVDDDDDPPMFSPKRKKQPFPDDDDDNSATGLDVTARTEASTPSSPPLPTMTPRELYHDRRNRLRQYYAHGSFYGCPAAYAAYTLATQSRFHDVGDLLWLACVGVTDAYLHARLDLSGYSALVLQLRDKCHTLYPTDEFTRIARQTVYAEQLLGTNSHNDTSGPLTKIAFTGNGRILAETDFRFFLLRHTSLYEAMRLSDYVSTQLQLPTAKGLHKLQEMLAQMGFPLAECQQPFCFMKPTLRRQLREKLQEQMHDYNLEHLEFTSFFRVTGYQSLLSASDTSYAVTALLEGSPDQTLTATRGASSDNDDDDAEEERRLLQAFYTALEALAPTTSSSSDGTSINSNNNNSLANLVNGVSLSSSSGLGAGLKLALQLQKSIIATATSLMDRNAITRLSHFRYAYITTTPQGEGSGSAPGGEQQQQRQQKQQPKQQQHQNTCFAQPLALTRLAHYLMDWNRANGKWAGPGRSRPLLLLAERPSGFLVVGCEFPEAAGDATRNRFGHYFELVAQSLPQGTAATAWRDLDSFDGHVVHVARPDAQRFLEQLHYLLDRMNE